MNILVTEARGRVYRRVDQLWVRTLRLNISRVRRPNTTRHTLRRLICRRVQNTMQISSEQSIQENNKYTPT